MAGAMVRASIPRSTWDEILMLDSARLQAVRTLLGEAFIQELTGASGVSWLSFEIEAKLADAVYNGLGAVEARALYRRKTARSFDIPLIRPVLDGALRLFGASPASIVKLVGRTWATISRDCGKYSAVDQSDQRRCESIVTGFPTRFYERRQAWLESALGGYEGFFTPFKSLKGRVTATDVNEGIGSARFILEW
jgi:hypothetical protein